MSVFFSVYLFYMNSEWLKVKSLQIHIIHRIHRNKKSRIFFSHSIFTSSYAQNACTFAISEKNVQL